jgi:aminopeptidase N
MHDLLRDIKMKKFKPSARMFGLLFSSFTIFSAVNTHAASGAIDVQTKDVYFPQLGNLTYDVQHYDLDFTYSGWPHLKGRVEMKAIAMSELQTFTIDSAVTTIHAVRVNGQKAQFTSVKGVEKIKITPAIPIHAKEIFTVQIEFDVNQDSTPASPTYPAKTVVAIRQAALFGALNSWQRVADNGFAFMGQPDRTHTAFPCNDTPADKATYRVALTTPAPLTGVSLGYREQVTNRNGMNTTIFSLERQAPTHVFQLAAGAYEQVSQGRHGNVELISYFPSKFTQKLSSYTGDVLREKLEWLEQTLGVPYPYRSFGLHMIEADESSIFNGVAIENTGLPTYSVQVRAVKNDALNDGALIHEMIHQWFANDVAVKTWEDNWLSEGQTNFYQYLYESEKSGDFDQFMLTTYASEVERRKAEGPPLKKNSGASEALFATNVPGALFLYSLRLKVGQEQFEKIQRTYLTRFSGRSASSADYTDIVREVAGIEVGALIQKWMTGKKVPSLTIK